MDEQTFTFKNRSEKDIPRLNQCWICGKWTVEEIMHPVFVPSQGTEYVKKLICSVCLLPISIDMQRLDEQGKDKAD
jgi:hypothetical protein